MGIVGEKDRYLFDVNGYLVVPQALSIDEVNDINRSIDEHGLMAAGDLSKGTRAAGFLEVDGSFRSLMAWAAPRPFS